MNKKIIGLSVFILLSLVPIFLLFYLGPNTNREYNFSEITHKLGQITALVGITMFALTFVLSSRMRFIENLFGGLDKMYSVHGILGGTALTLILFHPILLVLKFIPSNIKLAASYLLPSSFWSVNLGFIALAGMIILIMITLYSKIKYHKWKISHRFLGIIFILAVLHMFLVRGNASRDLIFNGYYTYAAIVSIIGIGSFSYATFIRNLIFKEKKYQVSEIRKNVNVYEIMLSPLSKPIQYKSGQFIFVRFYNNKLSKEQHPFSIASGSNENKIKIFVKNLGDFTSNLDVVKVGDKVLVEGPYGKFNKNSNENLDKVWIAGGIGITPFIGMTNDIINNTIKNKVYLFYSVKSREDLIALKYLKSIEEKNKNFNIFPWITNEKGYLNIKYISEKVGNLNNKEFYICGPYEFKKSLKKSIINSGVPEKRIHEEDFNFR